MRDPLGFSGRGSPSGDGASLKTNSPPERNIVHRLSASGRSLFFLSPALPLEQPIPEDAPMARFYP